MTAEWVDYFLSICDAVAKKSKDKSHKIGCVIVGVNHNILSTGFNGLPRRVLESDIRTERPIKYFFTEHAERNAIYNAARHGVALENSVLFVKGLPPCSDCARAIIQSGIRQVYVYFSKMNNSPKWEAEFIHSKIMFEEARVCCKIIYGE